MHENVKREATNQIHVQAMASNDNSLPLINISHSGNSHKLQGRTSTTKIYENMIFTRKTITYNRSILYTGIQHSSMTTKVC